MSGFTIKLVVLVTAAQSGISAPDGLPSDTAPLESAFATEQRVRFVERWLGPFDRQLATGPASWLETLHTAGVCSAAVSSETRESLNHDRQMNGLVGGGRIWTMHTSDGRRHFEWSFRAGFDESARDHGEPSWRITYTRREVSNHGPFFDDVPAAGAELRGALDEIIDFAVAGEAPDWTVKSFESARAALDGDDGSPAPEGLMGAYVRSDEARRLLDAAAKADLFGAMGSWNDGMYTGNGDREEYERVSNRLYLAIDRAIVAAVNANNPDTC